MAKRRNREFLVEVNSTNVSAELLGEVMQMHAQLPADKRGVMEVRMIHLFELLKEKGCRRRSSIETVPRGRA